MVKLLNKIPYWIIEIEFWNCEVLKSVVVKLLSPIIYLMIESYNLGAFIKVSHMFDLLESFWVDSQRVPNLWFDKEDMRALKTLQLRV